MATVLEDDTSLSLPADHAILGWEGASSSIRGSWSALHAGRIWGSQLALRHQLFPSQGFGGKAGLACVAALAICFILHCAGSQHWSSLGAGTRIQSHWCFMSSCMFFWLLLLLLSSHLHTGLSACLFTLEWDGTAGSCIAVLRREHALAVHSAVCGWSAARLPHVPAQTAC